MKLTDSMSSLLKELSERLDSAGQILALVSTACESMRDSFAEHDLDKSANELIDLAAHLIRAAVAVEAIEGKAQDLFVELIKQHGLRR